MRPSITNTMRRFSRSNSNRNSATAPQQSTTTGDYTPPLSHQGQVPQGSTNTPSAAIGLHDPQRQRGSRSVSSASDASYEQMNRPASQQYNQGLGNTGPGTTTATGSGAMSSLPGGHHSMPHNPVGGLSRTDQVVLRFFWEEKYLDNAKRDLHFLKFPFFPQHPAHTDLMPYCEIYHLVKTTPGANIISLGSANGVYIGFELAQGAQLHIDMDDEWRDISHHRVIFKPYDSVLRDHTSDATFKNWPKPLTIEFLEEQYRMWMRDLTSFCWIDEAVRDLGGEVGGEGGVQGGSASASGLTGTGTGTGMGSGQGGVGGVGRGSHGLGGHGHGHGLDSKGSRDL